MNKKTEVRAGQYVEAYSRRKRWQKIVTVLSAIVVFCTTYVLIMPAVTMKNEVHCGIEEHVHTDECYARVETLVCESTDEGQVHTEECYEVTADYNDLVCELEEHRHTLQCLSDPEANVETEGVWNATVINADVTGNWNEDVIAVAKTQLGYAESIENYKVSDDGRAINGYTRYGA